MYDVTGKRAALKMQILQVRLPLYPQVLLLMCVNMKICTGGEMVNTVVLETIRWKFESFSVHHGTDCTRSYLENVKQWRWDISAVHGLLVS